MNRVTRLAIDTKTDAKTCQWPDYEACVWLLAKTTGWTLEYIESLPYWRVMEGLSVLNSWEAGLVPEYD